MNEEAATLYNETDLALFSKKAILLERVQTHLQEKFENLKKRLEESDLTLENIISHMSEGLIFIKSDGLLTLFNESARKLIKHPEKHLIQRHYSELFVDDFFGFSLKKNLESKNAYHRVLLTLENKREVEISTSSIEERGLLIILRDRTEIQQLEKSLEQNERLKLLGEMAATLAHEIRNPLGAIIGFVRLLLRDIREDSKRHMLENILEGTDILNRLVSNVLDYSKELELHFSLIDLSKVIQETIDFLESDLKKTIIHFYPKSPFFAYIDEISLKRVFINLFTNARDAAAKNIFVELKENRVLVSDDGIGIEKKNLDKIFTPFFTTKAQGTGLGLAEVQKIIRAHGGEISASLSKKTTFIIKLRKNHAD